ncbi:F-box and associated interaction domains-containing protein [Hibiscus syriacus]|uniref:F-box and associated interaction domains-containing protein n=1 Tax=Hibiscus syriacus TaxID=106335 RepID=A0A6A2WXB7_HIBSY|nr:F-box protein At3g07870-like [Hibiscus syriacus]XP_039048678.1 F-box protein At3g07870-like [Hibiscus syriacus]KAE8660100.1 F-box and associated interaction domains-containing protein [Hibiscus syriacus]
MEPSISKHGPTPNTCRLFQLPHPIILDILSRLPIIDILHCRCVCKRFLCFISEAEFAWLHLSRSPLCILINSRPFQKSRKKLQLSHVDAKGEGFQVSQLNFTPISNVPTWDISDISACNGLLCLVGPKKGDPFYVCNPILGEFFTIQQPYKDSLRDRCWGLGYSTVTNQYKLLQSYFPTVESTGKTARIYTVGTGTWRSIGNALNHPIALPFNAFLNGALHFRNYLPRVGEFIHSFHFDTEQFGTVPPPDHFLELDNFDAECTTSGVLGDWLFITYFSNYRQIDIWVMKEYGVKESWTKQFVIRDIFPYGSGYYEPMVVLRNGEIFLLLNTQTIVCYSQKRKQIGGTKFFKIRSLLDAIAYTPCFVSLYNVAKGEQVSRMRSTGVYDKICKDEFLWL